MVVERVGEKYILIGTAHVSADSVNEVETIIAEEKPDVVAVELDIKRFEALTSEKDWRNVPISTLLKSDKIYITLANFLMSAFQKMVGQQVGSKPGEEMLGAINAAAENEAELLLMDGDITSTLKRALNAMTIYEKWTILKELFIAQDDEVEADVQELLDTYEDKEVLEGLIDQLKEISPGAYRVLLEERNGIMAKNLRAVPDDKKVVAVMGAAHMSGIADILENNKDIPPIEPMKPSYAGKIISYGLPLSFIAVFLFAIIQGISIADNLMIWVLVNGVLASFFTLLVGGSLVAIIVAFLAAPFTSLSPFLAAGWFAGLAEAWAIKLTFKDLEQVTKADDFDSLWKNKAFKVLLVGAAANIGSTIGTFLAIPTVLAPIMSRLF